MKIAIASGKGGTGKTFVSTNLAVSLSREGQKVTLVDCDAEEPNAGLFFTTNSHRATEVQHEIPVVDPEKCTFCGRCSDWCEFNAIMVIGDLKFIKVLDDICHGCGACGVACQYGAITAKPHKIGTVARSRFNNITLTEGITEVGAMSPVPVIKAAIKEGQSDDSLTLFDSPPGTACAFAVTVSEADYTILVAEPTPFGLSDMENSIEVLREMKKPFGIIINRAGTGDRDLYDYIKAEEIPLLAEIPFDREYALAYSNGICPADEDERLRKTMTGIIEKIITGWK